MNMVHATGFCPQISTRSVEALHYKLNHDSDETFRVVCGMAWHVDYLKCLSGILIWFL